MMPVSKFASRARSAASGKSDTGIQKKDVRGSDSRAGNGGTGDYISRFIENRFNRLHNVTQSRAAIAKAERDYLDEQKQQDQDRSSPK
jgi:hypothetical protein